MFNKKKIAISAGSSIVQIIVSGIATFMLFRVILESIGADKLGIWSLVIAASSMVQVGNMGMSGSIVKHVADCDAMGDKDKMAVVIQTTVISIALFTSVLILGAYPAAKMYFSFTLQAGGYHDAAEILPIALLAFLVMMVAGIYQGAMYGCQLIVHRNMVLVTDSILYLALCVLLLPRYGLMGLAYARLGQNFITLFITVILLRRYVPQLPMLPFHWNKAQFKEMLGYAANFQLISLLVMFSDPITKGFLSKYGSISMVGYYEMANRILQISRSLLVSANQVLVPTFARLEKLEPEKVSATYLISYQIVFYLTIPAFCFLAISAPLISEVLIGRHEPFFIWSMLALCFGWLINTLSVPAYFATIGTGSMRANVVSHLIMTLINLLLIFVLGYLWGGMGVMLAWSIALASGGVVMNVLYFRVNNIALRNVIPQASRWLTVMCLLGLIATYSIWSYSHGIDPNLINGLTLTNTWARVILSGVMVVVFAVIVALPVWVHPLRRKLYDMATLGRAIKVV